MTMAHASRLYPSWGTLKYADIDDVNAIKTAVATAAVSKSYSGADLDGVMANPGPALTKMHRLSVTTSASVGTYTITSAITATCTDQFGNTRTLSATLTAVNGNEIVEFTLADGSDAGAMTVTQIDVPAQNDANGQFEFGVTDVVFDQSARQIRGGAFGDVAVEYDAELLSGTAHQDVLPCEQGEHHDVFVKKILDTGTTAFPVTAYL